MVGSLGEASADCVGFLHLITKKLLALCKSRPQFMYSKELYVSRLRIIVKVKVTQLCLSLYNPTDSSSQIPLYGILQGKNTGESCHFFLQGIFPTQGLNPGIESAGRFLTA